MQILSSGNAVLTFQASPFLLTRCANALVLPPAEPATIKRTFRAQHTTKGEAMHRKSGVITGLAMACLLGAAHAQKPSGLPGNYPTKPIRVIISSSVGGAIDMCGRTVTTGLNQRWNHGFIAENRPGNGVAYDYVSKVAPDGYTLMASSISGFVGAELVMKLPINMRTKFPPIAQCISTPYIIAVNNDLPVKSIKELIAYAKANPNKLNFAYSNVGGAPRLFGELLQVVAGIDMQGIGFKGVGPSYLEQMAGRINLTTGTAASSGPLVKSGKIRAIAVTSARRLKALPDVPTMRETLPNFDVFEAWVGILGVEGMHPAIIAGLNREINAVLETPAVEKVLTADGSEIPLNSPEEFRKVIADSLESTAKIVKAAKLNLAE
jgi:tripartite-type tricarboxylate transporter receptor subunit TctC